MQIAMFFTLGLQVFPSRLPSVTGPALLIALFLMFVARPVSVLLVLLGSALTWRERVLVSWVGLRGAVPIVLATFPLIAGISKAGLMFDIVFFIVLTSALMQGTSLGWVAARLGLAGTGAPHIDPLELVSNGERDIIEISIGTTSPAAGKRIVDLDLPPNTLILLVDRAGTHIIPGGGTTLRNEDHVLVLTPKNQLPAVRKAVAG
jgi:cell volume regulation protein A